MPGIGPATERRILARLEAETDRPRQGLTLPTARDLVGRIAEALGGEIAGDPRRWADLPSTSVVVPTTRPALALDAFARLPQIVTVVEQADRSALGVTVEGVPVALLPEPGGLGAGSSATGTPAYVEALGPLPSGGRGGRVRRPRHPVVPAGAARGAFPRRAATARRARRRARRPSLPHDLVGREGVGPRDGGGGARARLRVPRDLRPHAERPGRPGLDADALRRQAPEIAEANEQLAPFRVLRGVEVDILRGGGLDLPDDVLAELDWVQLSLHAGQREPRRELTEKVTDAMRHPAVRCLSHPKGRILNHRPPNALDLERVFEVASSTAWRSR